MFSIITGILKATVGLLVNKGRDLAAEKLKDGDVTDHQFRNLVVRELDDVKSKIDALAKKDLLASISFFKEGIVSLYQLLDQSEIGNCNTATVLLGKEDGKLAVSLPSASGGSKISVSTSSLLEELKMLKLNELDATAKQQLLADAKRRFEKARDEATRAFSNEGLRLSDRILAMKIRIMATLLEKLDSPSIALAWCRLCLEELHKIPSVQNCFEVEITKPIKHWFNKNERREVIAEVCHMNFVVYSVTRMVYRDLGDVIKLPALDIGKLKIDPLRDSRLFKALSESRLEWIGLLEWTFGQEGEVNHRLDAPVSITTNTQGQFIVDDCHIVKVFNPSGKFQRSLCPLTEDEQKQLKFYPWSVATDKNDNLYVLASLQKVQKVQKILTAEWSGVYVFDKQYNLHHKFPLREGENILCYSHLLTVSNKVFVLVKNLEVRQVDVYETDGRFVDSFGQRILSSCLVRDITTDNHDRVMVLDGDTNCVNVFSTQGDHLHQFLVQGITARGAIAFHQPSEHVIVSSWNPDNEDRGQVSIYTKDGEFVRSIQLHTDKVPLLYGLTVTVDGLVAVTNRQESKVHVLV